LTSPGEHLGEGTHAEIDEFPGEKLLQLERSHDDFCPAISPDTLEHFSYLCGVWRGPGGPRDSRPGGQRYLFLQRPATLTKAGDPLYTNRQNALKDENPLGMWRLINGAFTSDPQYGEEWQPWIAIGSNSS
jgi:hypothetical protein